MSSINNIITTTFRAQGGNIVSQLNSYAQGFGRLGSVIDENTQMSSRLNNQWRAIGTTIRYAIAGTAIFGLQQMVRELSQVNSQLGQMQALTDIGQGARFNDTQMGQLLNGLIDTSNQTITPLSDVNDAAINFLSTVQGVHPNQLPQMLSDIGIAARLSQADMENVTQAATTMQIAFGRNVNPRTVGEFSRMFQQLIGTAPGGTAAGTTIAQAMPGLATMFQLAPGKAVPANIAQAQMMALTQGVLMTGMPAATGMRGLTYLLQSIAQPTGGAATALAGIGITPQFVQQNGIFEAVMRLLHQISPVSKTEQGRLGAIPDDTLDTMTTLPGIPASEMQRLRQMIPRIHGIRAAIILASQLQQRGDVQSIAQDLTDYVKVQNVNSEQAKRVARAAQDFRRNARMQEAATALHNAGIQIARAFNPLTNLVSGGIIDVAGAMQHHQQATTNIARGGAAFLGAMGIARFAGIRLPGFLGRITGAPGQRFVQGQAIQAALAHPTGLGASPQNPLYVTVVGQLFGGATAAPGGGGSGGGGGGGGFFGGLLSGIKSAAGVKYLTAFGGKIPGLVGRAGSAIEGFGAEIPGVSDWRMWFPGAYNPYYHRNNPDFLNLLTLGLAHRQHGVIPPNMYMHDLRRAQRVFPGQNITGLESLVRGQADVNLVIDITDPHSGRRTREKVHVPIALWSGGRHPHHRGQRKTIRTK